MLPPPNCRLVPPKERVPGEGLGVERGVNVWFGVVLGRELLPKERMPGLPLVTVVRVELCRSMEPSTKERRGLPGMLPNERPSP